MSIHPAINFPAAQDQRHERATPCPLCGRTGVLSGTRWGDHPDKHGYGLCPYGGGSSTSDEVMDAAPRSLRSLADDLRREEYEVHLLSHSCGDVLRLVAWAPVAPADHNVVAVWIGRRFRFSVARFPESEERYYTISGLRDSLGF